MKQSATLDTSFWINVQRAGLVTFVLERFDLYVTREVGIELSEAYESGREFWKLVRGGVISLAPTTTDLVRSFGRGERSAMNLAIEHPDWIFLVDDRRPLEEALRLGLSAVCTPSLVAEAFHRGLMNLVEAHQVLARLDSFNTVSPSLLAVARAQIETISRQKES